MKQLLSWVLALFWISVTKGWSHVCEIVERDYETYSGKVLERYFKEVMNIQWHEWVAHG